MVKYNANKHNKALKWAVLFITLNDEDVVDSNRSLLHTKMKWTVVWLSMRLVAEAMAFLAACLVGYATSRLDPNKRSGAALTAYSYRRHLLYKE